jgi:hypothetical protein
MPFYSEKRVKLPPDFKVGSKIYIIGEGSEVFVVQRIVRNSKGNVVSVEHDGGFREPLSKLCLIRSEQGFESMFDKNNFIQTEIGECDICKVVFPDSCEYFADKPNSMICKSCYKGKSGVKILI